MAVEITSKNDLERWLKDKPYSWSQTIALRSALRIFPIALNSVAWASDRSDMDSTLFALRAMVSLASARVVGGDPSFANHQLGSTLRGRAETLSQIPALIILAYDVSNPAKYIHDEETNSEVGAAAAATAVSYAAILGTERPLQGLEEPVEFWRGVEADCRILEVEGSPRNLDGLKLWPDSPQWWDEIWHSVRTRFSYSGQSYQVWREWYHGFVEGLDHAFAGFDRETDREFYNWLIYQSDEWWSREPAEVNAEIAKFVDDLRKPKDPRPDPKVDFFISYSNDDEAMAREVASVLDELGKTYIVQFRDFGPGENFVNAMNAAMKRAAKIIPLYSNAYMNSAHCNAEWDYFYNLDPSSAERRIIAFLLEPCDLKPLMQQITYKSLIGRKVKERRDAIREWIDWTPPKPSRAQAERTLQTTISPKIVAANDNELVHEANANVDSPQVPADLAEAFARLTTALSVMQAVSGNLSQTMKAVLGQYNAEIEANGLQSSWNALDMLMSVFVSGRDEMHEDEFHAGQGALFDELIGAHNACMTSLKNAGERIRDLNAIDVPEIGEEDAAWLTSQLEDIFAQIKKQTTVSEALSGHLEAISQSLKDIAHSLAHPSNAGKSHFTAKRLALTLGAFALGLLSASGDIASISGTEVGAGILAQLESFIDEFFGWLRLP